MPSKITRNQAIRYAYYIAQGACNATAISNVLFEVCKAEREAGNNPEESPLVAVIVEQLAWITRKVDRDKAYFEVYDLFESLPEEAK